MITAISFRNGTESRFLRHYINGECLNLANNFQNIQRIHIAVYQQSIRKPLFTCHFFGHFAGRKSLHIYQHCLSAEQAFEKALERFVDKLTQSESDSGFLSESTGNYQSKNDLTGEPLCHA